MESVNVTTSARYLLDRYYCFLKRFKADMRLYRIDFYILKDIAAHYWRDVERLHHFHNMPRIDCNKIAGYLAYWICKLRPINVIGCKAYFDNPNVSKFINEVFAIYVACGRINSELAAEGNEGGVTIENKTIDTLLYSLKYRVMPGDALSLFFEVAGN